MANMKRDPFKIARRIQGIRDGSVTPQPGETAEDVKMLPDEKPDDDKLSLSFSLTKPAMPNEIADQQIRLPQLLSQLGIDAASLGPDALGNAKLITMLRQKFGPDFMKDPRVNEVLSMFSSQVQSNPNEARAQLEAGIAGGNRIMSLLKNGLTGGGQ